MDGPSKSGRDTRAVTLHSLVFKAPSAPLVLALVAAVALGALLDGSFLHQVASGVCVIVISPSALLMPNEDSS